MFWPTALVEGMMSESFYIVPIASLLPLTAFMVVCQVNPYHALVTRGILGAVAALVYALFGAADVALTEALVGTMLSITLYAVAVRSSLRMRLGVLESQTQGQKAIAPDKEAAHPFDGLLTRLGKTLGQYHMRLELITYPNPESLRSALTAKEIHTTCVSLEPQLSGRDIQLPSLEEQPRYHLETRIRRLHDIMQVELTPTIASLTYVKSPSPGLPNTNDPDSPSKSAEGDL